MLETNSDRAWWMIGALVVGGAAIGILKVKYPEVLQKGIDYVFDSIPSAAGVVSSVLGLFS
ncbi:hypothetical protein CEQ21_07350 (plasmid) [Niallia circulans]|uniref:Uncharacterized protein n=1 Tax=Niallia circulans TaxID=1397 RepID=A0A553SQV3_NIACI|nr:hypothetical protein [Niallia circulans]TRZ39369.1 hypothetical protein CEQ21_07350 [Niallia circulans]